MLRPPARSATAVALVIPSQLGYCQGKRKSNTRWYVCATGPWDFRHIVLVLADRLMILQSMKPGAVLACLITLGVGGCSWIPRVGPSASEVVEQSRYDA